jgi:hypothetical protein
LRLHHYSIHTERSYIDWIKRYVQFHKMSCREDLADGERKIEAFLTDLAVRGKVAASTQNQAMNALVFLYRKVLEKPLDEVIDAVRAERKVNVPVVLTREEVSGVISVMEGVPQLIVTGRVERRRAGLDQWLPLCLPFRASWQMAIRSCRRFLHPLGSFRTAGFPQYGWKPAWSSCTLPKPSPASFDAGPAFLSVSGSVSRRLGSRLYPQALGSARFIIPAPAIATTA